VFQVVVVLFKHAYYIRKFVIVNGLKNPFVFSISRIIFLKRNDHLIGDNIYLLVNIFIYTCLQNKSLCKEYNERHYVAIHILNILTNLTVKDLWKLQRDVDHQVVDDKPLSSSIWFMELVLGRINLLKISCHIFALPYSSLGIWFLKKKSENLQR